MQDLDVRVAKLAETLTGQFDQLFIPLDSEDLAHQSRENCRSISRAGSNLEGSIARAGRYAFDHEGDDIRLGDSLSALDRQRRIQVCELGQMRRDKELAWNTPHRIKHSRVTNSPRSKLILNHLQSFIS